MATICFLPDVLADLRVCVPREEMKRAQNTRDLVYSKQSSRLMMLVHANVHKNRLSLVFKDH